MRLTEMTVRTLPSPERGQITYNDDNLAGFGVRVSQGGTKSFVLVHGRRRERITLGRYPIITLAQAREKAKLLLAESTLGHSRGSSITWEKAVGEFLEHRRRKNRPKTVKDYTRLLKHFPFGRARVRDLSRLDIIRRLDNLADTPAEQNSAYRSARALLRFIVQKGHLPHSPLNGTVQPSKLPSRNRVLSDDEFRRVWCVCCNTDNELPVRFRKIVLLLMLTGQRRGEIASLRTSWLNSETVTFPAEAVKNGLEHRFPLCKAAAEIIRSIDVSGEVNDILLFPSQHTADKPFSGWSKSKKLLDELSGVHNWRLHDLRRTFRTGLGRLGVAPHLAERLVNHISAQSEMERTYDLHHYLPEMRRAVELWEQHILTRIGKLCGIDQQTGQS